MEAIKFDSNSYKKFKRVCDNYSECFYFAKFIEKKDPYDMSLIYIYLNLCKLTDSIDIRNNYCRKAKDIYIYYRNQEISLLTQYDWSELELYTYKLDTLFDFTPYYLNKEASFPKGRCLLNKDDSIINRYQILKQIGKGTYSNVYKCRDHKYNVKLAIKCIRNDERYTHSGKKELDTLKRISHKGICNYIKHIERDNHTLIVFHLFKNNLYNELYNRKFKPFRPVICKQITRQLLDVLVYLKTQHIIHADIKPENILIHDYIEDLISIKMCDFGSTQKPREKFINYIQSRYYRAPEICMNRNEGCNYSIDMWSVSCVLFEILNGYPLFGSKTEDKLIYDIYNELGMPSDNFINSCHSPNKLLDQVYLTDHIVPHMKLSLIKDIDMDAYSYLVDTIKWMREDRLSCNDAMGHSFILN